MNRLGILGLAVMFSLLLSFSSVSAIDPYASVFSFEFTNQRDIFIDDAENAVVSIMAFHESSQGWILYIRHNDTDALPYDELQFSFTCDGLGSGEFNTTAYASWNSTGSIDLNMEYGDSDYVIAYNSVPFSGKYTRCSINITSTPSSFINNSAYDIVQVETIPLLATLEFLSCDETVTPSILLVNQMSSFVDMNSDMWTITWYVYSIFIIILALFGIPMLAFMLIRFVVFRLSGYKIGGEEKV